MGLSIGGVPVGSEHPPYVIAEMSGNHGGELERALQIVDAVADAGVHAIKLQTYTADTMTLDVDRAEFVIQNPESLWYGRRLHELYEQAHTPWEWHEPLMRRAEQRGIACFSSPFDDSAVDFLEDLGAPAYKIASSENVDLPLIRKVCETGKPVVISTGMAQLDEIAEAVEAARDAGCRDLVLLRCTTSYPADPDDTHLRTIPDLRRRFACEVGLSDHTLGIGVAVASVALGASVIEKHVTLDRSLGGVDAAFSLEPDEFAALVTETERAWRALGEVRYEPTDAERGARTRRRSLYLGEDVRDGDILTPANLRRVRPGAGLAPRHYDQLLGRRVRGDHPKGTPVSWDIVDAG